MAQAGLRARLRLQQTTQTQSGRLDGLRVSLRLGLTSFGGPIVISGYFRDEYRVRRRWLDEAASADPVALAGSRRARPVPARRSVFIF